MGLCIFVGQKLGQKFFISPDIKDEVVILQIYSEPKLKLVCASWQKTKLGVETIILTGLFGRDKFAKSE